MNIIYRGRELYCKGNAAILDEPAICFAGTRHPGRLSEVVGYRLAKKSCELSDGVLMTGLAIGCDTVAARAALDVGTPVIGVLPSGTDNVYPRSNRRLAEEILEKGGCLISEYPPDAGVEKWKFIARDRLMAHCSEALIVIECGEQSGTMHTVREADKAGKKMACWMPKKIPDGSFGGNIVMAEKYNAACLWDTDDLRDFLRTI